VVAQAGEGYYKDSKAISGAVNHRLVGSGAAYAYVIRLSPGGPPRRAAPNGLELSCPAEAGSATRTLGHVGGPDKPPRRPSPPGQLQRVVSRPQCGE